MGARPLPPDRFERPKVTIVKDNDPWVRVTIDTGARRKDKRRVRSKFSLGYHLDEGRWAKETELEHARANERFRAIENQVIDMIFSAKGE